MLFHIFLEIYTSYNVFNFLFFFFSLINLILYLNEGKYVNLIVKKNVKRVLSNNVNT